MAKVNQFKIRAALDPMASTVELNGEPLNGVVSVSFELAAKDRKATTVKLQIIGEVEVDGEFVEKPIAVSADVS